MAATPGATHVLALDEGTTGVTALVVDAHRAVLGHAYREVAVATPRPGWVEQDPVELLRATVAAGAAALEAAGLQVSDVVLGIANQRETTVVWDRVTGRPVYPAIVWQDRRTAARCDQLRPRHGAMVRKLTGLVVDPYFCATKLEWILAQPGVRQRAEQGELAFGTVDAWLSWALTGRHATDPANASRTLLWDLRRDAWSPRLCKLFDIPAALLPEIVPSGSKDPIGVVGAAPTPLKRWTKPLQGAALHALVGDQQAALLGQGCTKPGQAKCTYGTGAFLLQHTGARPIASRHGLLATRAATLEGTPAAYALEGSVFTAGALIQWLRDSLRMVDTAAETDRLAATVPDSAGLVIVPAFTGLGAPHWDADARGTILGLTRGATRAHVARAALEAIALQVHDVVTAMEQDSGLRLKALRVDGGASRSEPLLQIQADLLQRRVERPVNIESTALGAAALAGAAALGWSLVPKSHAPVPTRPKANRLGDRDALLRAWDMAVHATKAFKPV